MLHQPSLEHAARPGGPSPGLVLAEDIFTDNGQLELSATTPQHTSIAGDSPAALRTIFKTKISTKNSFPGLCEGFLFHSHLRSCSSYYLSLELSLWKLQNTWDEIVFNKIISGTFRC